jgi:hypothetical protein
VTETGEPPRRFVRSRMKGTKMPEGTVYVGRPSRWGNRWKAEAVDGVGWCCLDTETRLIIQARDRADAHDLAAAHYRARLAADPGLVEDIRAKLRGKDLMCWCPHGVSCHADVLLEIANA